MKRKRDKKMKALYLYFFILVFSVLQSYGQDFPTVGLSVERHTGIVLHKDVSPTDSLIATVSEDRTLKIWKYPACRFLQSINMPEKQGDATRLGHCLILSKDIILVADDSGNDYEYRVMTNEDRIKRQSMFEIGNKPSNFRTRYCFYAVDWRQRAIVDRIGAMSAPITGFHLSPNKSMLLVTSSGEEAMLYDAGNLRLIHEFSFDDEVIIGGRFISQNELVICTDMYYYKFEIIRFSNVDWSFRTQVAKKRISNKIERVLFSEDGKYAYLFSKTRFLYAINTQDNLVLKDELPLGYTEHSREMEANSIISYKNGETRMRAAKRKDKRWMNTLIYSYRISPALAESISDSVFLYRTHAAPSIQVDENGFNIRYENQPAWRFTKNGLSLIQERESEIPVVNGKRNATLMEGVINGYSDVIRLLRKHIDVSEKQIVYLDSVNKIPRVNLYDDDKSSIRWSSVLAASAENVYQWVNPRHFLLSLNDGTLRWYNTHTGKEELALFISKEGEWILWTPGGQYSPSSPKAGNMIEWRYRSFSSIEIKKPMNNRREYCRPGVIANIIAQLYDSTKDTIKLRRFDSFNDIVQINYAESDGADYYIEYSLKDYDPIKYGWYQISLYLDDDPCDNIKHYLFRDGGNIIAKSEPGVKSVDIELHTEYKGVLAPITYDLEKSAIIDSLYVTSPATYDLEKSIDSLYVTCIGINKYDADSYSFLRAPVNDAQDMADIFSDKITVNDVLWENKNIRKLFDEEANVENINARFEDILSASDSSNILSILFFSGHGMSDGKNFFIVLSSGEIVNISALAERCSQTKGKFIFIMDACFSGQLVQNSLPNVAVMASSDAVSKSKDGRNELSVSAFTKILEEKFSEIQDVVSLDDLCSRVYDKKSDYQNRYYNNIKSIIFSKISKK